MRVKYEINVGEKVVVKNETFIYPRYKAWVKENAPKEYGRWIDHGYNMDIKKGHEGVVLAKGRHEYDRYYMYLIEVEGNLHVVDSMAIRRKRK